MMGLSTPTDANFPREEKAASFYFKAFCKIFGGSDLSTECSNRLHG